MTTDIVSAYQGNPCAAPTRMQHSIWPGCWKRGSRRLGLPSAHGVMCLREVWAPPTSTSFPIVGGGGYRRQVA